jgi:CHAT domain-containing protein
LDDQRARTVAFATTASLRENFLAEVASLWKVADLPTQELMVNFYRKLVNGAGRSDALRRAQLAMLANSQQSHPYYWASFVAVGGWKPLSTN